MRTSKGRLQNSSENVCNYRRVRRTVLPLSSASVGSKTSCVPIRPLRDGTKVHQADGFADARPQISVDSFAFLSHRISTWAIECRRPWQRSGMGVFFRVSVVRVLVVDDFAGFRDAICSMLRNRPDMLVVGEASDGLEAVRKAEDLQPDLIVLDLSMPKLNGLEATRRIRTLSPKSKIIIASLESSADFVQEALRSGAAGYVIKAELFNQLPPAIDAVLQGKRWFVEPVDDIR
jgi:CheY-like chemotaxis protein